MNIAITGANGSVGTTLLRHLARTSDDIQVLACVRSQRAAATLPASPRISPRVVSYDDRERLTSTLTGTECLVHLAGILIESPTSAYQTANVDATRVVVEACKAAGVRHIVLVSVLGANPQSPNRYLRSKGETERLVAESGVAATIIRTPILMGPRTAGGRSLVRNASQHSVRLLGGGRYTTRPLDVDDLCAAILNSCRTPAQGVTVHELAGPESTTYHDLVVSTARLMGRTMSIRSMPIWLAKAGASVAGWFKGGGMTPTVIDVITSNESVTKNADADLGVSLTPMSKTIQKLVHADGNA